MVSHRILGLTLHQPWAWCIVGLPEDRHPKRVENRTWSPRGLAPGDFLAIHAGQTFDEGAVPWLRRELGILSLPGEARQSGVIVAVARFVGVETSQPFVDGRRDPWWHGPVGWRLEGVVALPEPVPCRGAQGLWPLKPDVLAKVRDGYREVTAIASKGCICPGAGEDPVRCYALRTQGFYIGKGVGPMAEYGQPDECGCGCHDAWEPEEDDA